MNQEAAWCVLRMVRLHMHISALYVWCRGVSDIPVIVSCKCTTTDSSCSVLIAMVGSTERIGGITTTNLAQGERGLYQVLKIQATILQQPFLPQKLTTVHMRLYVRREGEASRTQK